ncbi:MAG: hypothetical protein Q9223_001839 [Gallowayella weberi]
MVRLDDGGANLDLCLEIQDYYQRHNLATRVKAAGLTSMDEAEKLAGVEAVTVAPHLLRSLSNVEESRTELISRSIFIENTVPPQGKVRDRETFVNDEKRYQERFIKTDNGRGSRRTREAIEIFRQYQIKAEVLMLDNDPMKVA